MTNKHLWVRRLSSLLFLTGVVIAGCGSTVDDQDAGSQCAGSGCDAGPQCAADEFFVYDDGLCGKGSSAGFCASMNDGCTPDYPVCGCDGIAYPTRCETNQRRMHTTSADQCTAPPGTFACGHTYCTRNTTFCHDFPEDSGGGAYCDPMPPECASAPSCACIQKSSSYDECEDDGMGGLHATEPSYTD